MFHRFRALLAVSLFFMMPVSAQTDDSPQEISYQSNIPKNVAKSVPRRAKRVFWETFISQKGAPQIGVQLYQIGSIVTLELWQRTPKKFVRINCIPSLFDLIVPSDARFAAKFYWVDKAKRTTPVLVIKHIAKVTLMPGDYLQFQVIGLPTGWRGKLVVQTFFDGASNAGDDGFDTAYNDKGQLELKIFSGDHSGYSNSVYAWDGKQFSDLPERKVTVIR